MGHYQSKTMFTVSGNYRRHIGFSSLSGLAGTNSCLRKELSLLEKPSHQPSEWLSTQHPPKHYIIGQSMKHDKEDAELLICQSHAAWRAETSVAGLRWIICAQESRDMEQSKSSSHVTSPLMAEALALREAIYDSLRKGFTNIRSESDSPNSLTPLIQILLFSTCTTSSKTSKNTL